MIRTEKVSVTTTGSAGSASGNSDSRHPLNGRLVAVYLDYHASAPATTDVTITTKRAPIQTLLTLSNVNADNWYYPRYVVHSEAGAALTGTAGGDRTMHPLDDDVNVSVAQCDALTDAVTVYFLYEC